MPISSSSDLAANKDMMSKYGQIKVQLSNCVHVENIVGNEEIALYEPFVLFPQCFQKPSVVHASK